MANKLNQMMKSYQNHMNLPSENEHVVDDFTSVGSKQQYITAGTRIEEIK